MVIFWFAATANIPTDGDDDQLCDLMKLLRESVKEFDDDYLKRLQGEEGFVANSEFIDRQQEVVSSVEPEKYAFTSWTKIANEVDFGWGRPFWIGVMGKVLALALAGGDRFGWGRPFWLWLSLISSPKFCDSHTLRNPIPKFSSALFISRPTTTNPHFNSNPSTPLNFIPDPQGLNILQSCNGFLLCSSSTDKFTSLTKFYAVNPTTRRFSEISLPSPSPKRSSILSVALAFDPSKSPHYKLLCLSNSVVKYSLGMEIEIYSSQTQTCRVCETTNLWLPSVNFVPGVYCNGRINWLTKFCWLVHYDIDEGNYGVVDEFRGYDLSVGKDYSGWFFKYTVDLNLMRATFPCTSACYYPLFFLDLEEENPVILLWVGNKFISYSIRDKRFCTSLVWDREDH